MEKTHLDEYKEQGIEKRYAFEWYVKDADELYWNMAKERIDHEADKLMKKQKRITALAVTSTVIAVIAISMSVSILLHK